MSAHVLPWYENPFRLISWGDMLRFSAHQFINVGSALQIVLDKWGSWDEIQRKLLIGTILVRDLSQIASGLDELGCNTSGNLVRSLVEAISRGIDSSEIETRVQCAQETIKSEMESHLFFWMSPEVVKFYRPVGGILGKEFHVQFPSADRDARNAGECLAFGQSTACVFHLMRVMEVCLRSVESSLQLPLSTDRNWGAILDRWNSFNIKKFPASEAIWQQHHDFYRDSRATLCSVKDAWRNQVMHVDRDYDETEAIEILSAVRSFTRKLASKINESGLFV